MGLWGKDENVMRIWYRVLGYLVRGFESQWWYPLCTIFISLHHRWRIWSATCIFKCCWYARPVSKLDINSHSNLLHCFRSMYIYDPIFKTDTHTFHLSFHNDSSYCIQHTYEWHVRDSNVDRTIQYTLKTKLINCYLYKHGIWNVKIKAIVVISCKLRWFRLEDLPRSSSPFAGFERCELRYRCYSKVFSLRSSTFNAIVIMDRWFSWTRTTPAWHLYSSCSTTGGTAIVPRFNS
jgi:hypothetical protein